MSIAYHLEKQDYSPKNNTKKGIILVTVTEHSLTVAELGKRNDSKLKII